MSMKSDSPTAPPAGPTAALVLADGTVFRGHGLGATGMATGEVCFNTSLTGYQEILTDPSYASQIITFTFPHIGNVGTNDEDVECVTPSARGCVLRADVTQPSNWRALQPLADWLRQRGLIALTGVDTRQLTRRIRDHGAPSGTLVHAPDGALDLDGARAAAQGFPGLKGLDLTTSVTCGQTQDWTQGLWKLGTGYAASANPRHHVVAIDYGCKHNILRCLTDVGCKVTVVPATTDAEDILARQPDGIFLSNGPGDPAAAGSHALPTLRRLLDSGTPMMGICLGHQLLALALGGQTGKMDRGHRGANHPVKDLATGRVEITSQNHGFVVLPDSLPDTVETSHVSLFDGSVEGLRLKDRPVFSVQYHPEASPGPQDSHYLFKRFAKLMAGHQTG